MCLYAHHIMYRYKEQFTPQKIYIAENLLHKSHIPGMGKFT